MKQTLVALVENEPGVLNRVASLFRRRNFNIDSLTVGRTENPNVSRMTIVFDSQRTRAYLVEKNLYKLVNVISVQDVTEQPFISRDLALLKVQANSEAAWIASQHGARMVDHQDGYMIFEFGAEESKIEAFVEAMRPFDIVELVRTGVVAMGQGAVITSQPEELYLTQA
jgi:acetolactate synthase I/III small subunit